MAQKKCQKDVEEEASGSFLSRFVANLRDGILGNVIGTIKDNIKDKIRHAEKRFIRWFSSYIFLFLGVISIAISLIFGLEFYFNLNRFWGFLISGLLFLLISFILRMLLRRD